MSEHMLAQPQRANAPQGTTKVVGSLQRRDMNQPEPTTLQEWFFDTASGTFAEPRSGFDFSGVPALTGMVRQNRPLLRMQPMLQRSPKDGDRGSSPCPTCLEAEPTEISEPSERAAETAATIETTETIPEAISPEGEAIPTPAETETESAVPGETPASALIVEDSATDLVSGQMKKSEFLSQLRTEVCRTVEQAISDTGRTTEDCPYLNRWFDFYDRQDSAYIERTIHRYAPEASDVTSASGYISVITQRARQSAETWARTGEITGVPEGLPWMGLLGGIGRLFSGISSIFFKAREGGVRKSDDPRAIQEELGEGRPLDSGVRSRMGSAFDMDFAHVRTHTDSMAAGLSNRFNARAFTRGEHVAFGANEYKPGTLIGDALIAHELAHVVQQSDSNSSVAPMKIGDVNNNTLEKDADNSAFGAIGSIWSRKKGSLVKIGKRVIPYLKSGLRLQCCKRNIEQSGQTLQQVQRPPVSPVQTPAWTEVTGGDAACDTNTGTVVWNVTIPANQSCLQPCADAHESAHEIFLREQCTRVSAAIQRSQEALQTAQRVQTLENLTAAEAAVQEAERATDEYLEWFSRTCPENESQAYRATVEFCGTPEAQQRCRDAGQEEAYRRNLELWRSYITNPPHCPGSRQ